MERFAIKTADFNELIVRTLPDMTRDENQLDLIGQPPCVSAFVVAGPGSGKTAVLALRVLKLILVDQLPPNSILATTFTRRAAKELRSRILAWGELLRDQLLTHGAIDERDAARLRTLDLNTIITGTLDSIAQDVLLQCRLPGSQPPSVSEAYACRLRLLRAGLFPSRRDKNPDLVAYLKLLRGDTRGRVPNKQLVDAVMSLRERISHDAVNVERWRQSSCLCRICGNHPHKGISVVYEAIEDYLSDLRRNGLVDFAELERQFLAAIRGGVLDTFTNQVQAIFVDEYQDTNVLQENIYMAIARRAIADGGSITVVGDDDQSLYRFRGATVDLFRLFPERLHTRIGVKPQPRFISVNYRSTSAIVDFCNAFVTLDDVFQHARVANKPPLLHNPSPGIGPRVMGLFRPDAEVLAADLAALIHGVFVGRGFEVPGLGLIRRNPKGSIGDCALLCHSTQEGSSRLRLPFLIRRELGRLSPPIRVYNPRGQELASIPSVERLCGLLLECADAGGTIQAKVPNLPHAATEVFDRWRERAVQHMEANDSLLHFVELWRESGGATEGSLIELAYRLLEWIPEMQDDIEGLAHLEVVLRTLTEAGQLRPYGGYVRVGTDSGASDMKFVLWNVLVPIALDAVDVDEDLLDTLPRDRLNILTIHQAKGLEFPMAIVDVGSDYKMNHPRQRRLRFPEHGDVSHNLEDELRPFSEELSVPPRTPRDRAFDDLTRQYYVAFSRARDILILVGLHAVRDQKKIPHVATGWSRNGTWHWGSGLPNLIHI